MQAPELEGLISGTQSNQSDHMLDSTSVFSPGWSVEHFHVDMDSWQHQLMNEELLLAVVPVPLPGVDVVIEWRLL